MTQPNPNPHAPDPAFPKDSPTSEFDAGVDDPVAEEATAGDYDESLLDSDDFTGSDTDIDVDLPPGPDEEIPLSSLDVEGLDDPVTRNTVRSPEMSDLNVPGEVDIEALGDDDINESLPPDARLDPLEE